MARLFFALWPSEAAAIDLAQLGQEMGANHGGRPVPMEKVHLTLAFLGEIAEDRIAEAMAISVDFPAFELTLDRAGSFRKARIGWAAAASPPEALMQLQSALSEEVRRRGFSLEERTFAPHVTLVRKMDSTPSRRPIAPVRWAVQSVALVRSEMQAGRYVKLAVWRLGG